MMLDRRKFLMAALAVAAMPTIVRAESLMCLPVRKPLVRIIGIDPAHGGDMMAIVVTGVDQYGYRVIERVLVPATAVGQEGPAVLPGHWRSITTISFGRG